MSYTAVIFDLDGTLIDSAPSLCASLNLLLTERGRRSLSTQEVTQMIGEGAEMLVKRALAAVGDRSDWVPLTRRFLEIYSAQATAHIQPFHGAGALLRALGRQHHLALCTNKPERPTRLILDQLSWTDHFDCIVGGDSLPRRKPDPLMVTHILQTLQLPPTSAVLIGDSPADAGAAQAAGVDFVAVSWGYSRQPLDTLCAVAVVDQMEQIAEILASGKDSASGT